MSDKVNTFLCIYKEKNDCAFCIFIIWIILCGSFSICCFLWQFALIHKVIVIRVCLCVENFHKRLNIIQATYIRLYICCIIRYFNVIQNKVKSMFFFLFQSIWKLTRKVFKAAHFLSEFFILFIYNFRRYFFLIVTQ